MEFPSGGLLQSKVFSGSSVPAYTVPVPTIEVTFDAPVAITSGSTYAIVVSAPDAAGATWDTGMSWRLWSNTPSYTDGEPYTSTNSGSTWTEKATNSDYHFITKAGAVTKDSPSLSGGSASVYFGGATWAAQTFIAASSYSLTSVVLELHKYAGVNAGDLTVAIYGGYAFTPPPGTATKKYLVSVANNKVYLGTGPDDMAEVAAATGLSTASALDVFGAYGKFFFVNESTKKVLDCQNTKIATADVGANPPDRGNTLTGGTSGAKLVVDYVTSLSGACTIYGFRITADTFGTETVTGTDNDGNAISFTTSGAETAPPHWYDWTVYGSDTTTYGSLPDSASIGCLSGGRCVLNNTSYPHQAPASAAGNPWDWNIYRTTADRATVIGSGSSGQIGDVVRALIPARDGQLIIGCTGSIHVMIDNPAYGGQMVDINDAGLFGGRSWCFDSNGNLYFWGTGGIYRLVKGAVQVENLTAVNLPNLIGDTGADPSTHRITMGYDPVRQGIKICITVLASGSSQNYWIDLLTSALLFDTHASTHGVYAIHQYDANNPDDRGLLLGSADGYMRVHDDDEKNDDGIAIDSYIAFGPIPLADDGRDGSVEAFDLILAGGATGGCDDVAVEVWTEDVAETVVEDLDAGTNPKLSMTFAGPGRARGAKRRRGVRGAFAGIKIGNSTLSETWGMEKLLVDSGPEGRRLR